MATANRNWALLPDDITRDIFARLRPSEPLYLFQVSHLCKDWLRALTDPDFPRRLHELSVTPLSLGFLHGLDDESVPTFVRTTNWPFSPADVPERRHWKVLDYRHGRALFLSTKVRGHGGFDLLVWDPISGDRHHVPVPPEASRGYYPGAALVCAAPGCNHRPGCNGGHFQVAFIANQPVFFDDGDPDDEEMEEAFIYSSETESWIKLNPIPNWSEAYGERPSVLVGHSVYIMSDGLVIFELDLVGLTFSEIPSPDVQINSPRSRDGHRTILTVTEDGRLGMAEERKGYLYLWSMEVTGSSTVTWVQTRSINPYEMCFNDRFDLIGFAEGANVIFMRLPYGIYALELSSETEQTRTVLSETEQLDCVFPVVSFYATHNVLQGPGGVQHNLPNTSVDDGDKGIEGEGKALEVAQQLFNDGSNSIEQMDFLNAVQCLRQSLDIRVGHYGKLATECATTYYKYGCALLYKARKSTDCIANVHKETATEESVKNKEYDENSKASGTNAEDAPSLEKVDSDEGRKSNDTNQEYGMRAGDQDGSDLELAWEMLDIARKIVEKSPNDTTDMVHILSVLDEVNIERGKKESNSEHNVCSPSTDPEAVERGTFRALRELEMEERRVLKEKRAKECCAKNIINKEIASQGGVEEQAVQASTASESSPWAGLDADLIVSIVSLILCPAERVQAAYVNRWWRQVLKKNTPKPPAKLQPWAIFPSSQSPRFHSTDGKTTYKLNLPDDVKEARFIGSFEDWWFALAWDEPHKHELFHMKTDTRIILPIHAKVSNIIHKVKLDAVVLSAPPVDTNYFAAAILKVEGNQEPMIGFWRKNMLEWVVEETLDCKIEDIVWYLGSVHILTTDENVHMVEPGFDQGGPWRISYCVPERLTYSEDVELTTAQGPGSSLRRYLVNSGAYLLMVVKHQHESNHTEFLRVVSLNLILEDDEEDAVILGENDFFRTYNGAMVDYIPGRASWDELEKHYGRHLFVGRACSRLFWVRGEQPAVYFLDDRSSKVPGTDLFLMSDRGRFLLIDRRVEAWPPTAGVPLLTASNRLPIWCIH